MNLELLAAEIDRERAENERLSRWVRAIRVVAVLALVSAVVPLVVRPKKSSVVRAKSVTVGAIALEAPLDGYGLEAAPAVRLGSGIALKTFTTWNTITFPGTRSLALSTGKQYASLEWGGARCFSPQWGEAAVSVHRAHYDSVRLDSAGSLELKSRHSRSRLQNELTLDSTAQDSSLWLSPGYFSLKAKNDVRPFGPELWAKVPRKK